MAGKKTIASKSNINRKPLKAEAFCTKNKKLVPAANYQK